MRTIVIALMLVWSLCGFTNSAAAQSRQFPYDALIVDDDVYARSGPGQRYYPTSRFRKGERVTVVRHDPGGWFMIEPPPGSFAWVRQEFVKRDGDRGTIVSDGPVIAWVGTSFGDDHFVEQRRLQRGEDVEIIADKGLKDERGEVAYFKIQVPKGHYRWISGAKVVTSDKRLVAATRHRGGDPFAKDADSDHRVRDPDVAPVGMADIDPGDDAASVASNSKAVSPPRNLGKKALASKETNSAQPQSRPPVRSNNGPDTDSPFSTSRASGDDLAVRERLAAIDEQLQDLDRQDTRDWDFTGIERNLRELQQHDDTATAASRRLAQLDKYKQIKADYDEFTRITDEANRRDAELAAAQKAAQPFFPPTVVPEPQPHATTRPANVNRAPVPGLNALSRPAQPGRSPAPAIRSRPGPTPQPTMPGTRQPAPTNAPAKGRFGGAGIIQRSAVNKPGAPKHVLMHPNGRVLAFLQGDGVDLDKYLGESMGLEGERAFRPDLQSDFMVVKSLSPVKLKP